MHIKSIVSDEDREELERMLSLGFIIPNQLFKTRQKSRMIIYIFTPVEFLLSINCYLSESYLMFGIGIGTCVACVAWIIWYQMIGKNFEKNVHEFVWGRSGYETVDIDENAIKIDEDQIYEFKNIDRIYNHFYSILPLKYNIITSVLYFFMCPPISYICKISTKHFYCQINF